MLDDLVGGASVCVGATKQMEGGRRRLEAPRSRLTYDAIDASRSILLFHLDFARESEGETAPEASRPLAPQPVASWRPTRRRLQIIRHISIWCTRRARASRFRWLASSLSQETAHFGAGAFLRATKSRPESERRGSNGESQFPYKWSAGMRGQISRRTSEHNGAGDKCEMQNGKWRARDGK